MIWDVFVFGVLSPFSFLWQSSMIRNVFFTSIFEDTSFFHCLLDVAIIVEKSLGRSYSASVVRMLLAQPILLLSRVESALLVQ